MAARDDRDLLLPKTVAVALTDVSRGGDTKLLRLDDEPGRDERRRMRLSCVPVLSTIGFLAGLLGSVACESQLTLVDDPATAGFAGAGGTGTETGDGGDPGTPAASGAGAGGDAGASGASG